MPAHTYVHTYVHTYIHTCTSTGCFFGGDKIILGLRIYTFQKLQGDPKPHPWTGPLGVGGVLQPCHLSTEHAIVEAELSKSSDLQGTIHVKLQDNCRVRLSK